MGSAGEIEGLGRELGLAGVADRPTGRPEKAVETKIIICKSSAAHPPALPWRKGK